MNARASSAVLRARHQGQPVNDLTVTMTPREIAVQVVSAIRALNELTSGSGELSGPRDFRDIVASLELAGQGLPQLCEQLARFLVTLHEDGQLGHGSGLDPDSFVTDVIEALAAAGQAADMMTAALTEARTASAGLTPGR
jgi:hypothetical protein